jgi:hypothetical protein
MGQYLLYKMEKKNVHSRLRDCTFVKMGMVLERQDLQMIQQELIGHRNRTKSYPITVSKAQVEMFRLNHHSIKGMEKKGSPFLHGWMNTLVDGIFKQKHYYDAYYVTNSTDNKKDEWTECEFHEDVTEGDREDMNFQTMNDRSPISVYFPVGETPIRLDIECEDKGYGRPRVKKFQQITLDAGDILIFKTTQCRHRTSTPIAGTSLVAPGRVNIILTGFREIAELTDS